MFREPDPDNPGWYSWVGARPDGFSAVVLGKLLVRAESDRTARVRLTPARHHANRGGTFHGAMALALIDVAIFATGALIRGEHVADGVTLDVSCQFIGAGSMSEPVDAVTEVLRETGRLVFMRGLIVQGDALVASYTGTVRKLSKG